MAGPEMARVDRLEVYSRMLTEGLVPVASHLEVAETLAVARALTAGGGSLLELTHRGVGAYDRFTEVRTRCRSDLPDLIVGVGSIDDPATAALYLAAGADFVVGPGCHAETAVLCNRQKVPYLPGCGTLTEIATAEGLGCEIVKLFPGDTVGGPAFVRAVLGPRPWSRLMPTGGVAPTTDSLAAWFDAGVAAVGIGSKLLTPDLLRRADYDELTEVTRASLATIARHSRYRKEA